MNEVTTGPRTETIVTSCSPQVRVSYRGRLVTLRCNGIGAPFWVWLSQKDVLRMRLVQSAGQHVVMPGTENSQDNEDRARFVLRNAIDDPERIKYFIRATCGHAGLKLL